MKRQRKKRIAALVLALTLSVQAFFALPVFLNQAYAYTERSATINASSLNVRSGPGTSYSQVGHLYKDTPVTVINETTGTNGSLWYQIRYSAGGGTATGYVLSTYLRFPMTYTHDSNFEAYLDSQGFPESYRESLRRLHAQYPQWVFQAHQTGLDWNTVIQNESMIPRSLIHTSSISSYKSTADGAYNWDNGTWTGFDGSSWVAASEEILRYYMDPRNFLDDVYIFQFMNHKYDPSTQTREGLEQLVKGTFLEGTVSSDGSMGNWQGSGNKDANPSPVSPGTPASSSSGVILSPGTQNQSSGSGPGVTGSGSSKGLSDPSSGQEVHLRAPQASVSKHEAKRVASSAVRVGVKPGQDGTGNTDPNVQTGGAPVVTAPSQSTTPVVTPGSPSSSPGTPSPSGSSSPENSPQSPVQNPGNGGNSASSVSYVDILLKAAEVSGVNPYVLASMIIQEQGSDGRGNSIAGNHSAYPGYYNYFNVGAYAANGMGAVERGLWYASQTGTYGRPWNSPEKSIIGGAQFYGENYVRAGQDTFYLKKYNVQGNNLYNHQYMTNVDGAASEGSIFAESYSSRLSSMALCFKIPVYGGMPESPSIRPSGDGSPNNKLKGLGIEGFTLTPTFNRDIYSYDVIVDGSVNMVSVYAQVIDSSATVSGIGMVQLASGSNEIRVRVRAKNGSERDYTIHIVRQGTSGGEASGSAGGQNPPGIAGPGGSTPSGNSGPGGSTDGAAGVSTPGGSNVIVINP